MIIDAILDRKDNEPYGIPYNSYEVLKYMYDEAMIFNFDYLSRALDYGTEEDIKEALCKYIDNNNYNPAIKNYIKSKNWLE